jgi:ABC-type transport system substrate-binding protein
MAKAGVDMKLLGLDWPLVVQRLEKKEYEACVLGWTTGLTPDPYQLWHSSQADVPASSNHIRFKNAEADKLIAEIRSCFDQARRIELCRKFHALLAEEQPYTFLFSPDSLQVINRRYRNRHVFPLGLPESILWTPKAEQMAVPGR